MKDGVIALIDHIDVLSDERNFVSKPRG